MALTMIAPNLTVARPNAAASSPSKLSDASQAADDLAAAFLAEMLSFAGLNDAIAAQSGFGGEAMSGFLLREYSEKIVDQGGLGISQMILSRLKHAEIADDR